MKNGPLGGRTSAKSHGPGRTPDSEVSITKELSTSNATASYYSFCMASRHAERNRSASRYDDAAGRQFSRGRLVIYFLAWKLLLLVIACLSPGPGYDTSTQILLDQYKSDTRSYADHALERLVLRLTRWDGIYFASSSERGHVHEQEWAFSWALAKVTSWTARGA